MRLVAECDRAVLWSRVHCISQDCCTRRVTV